MERDERHLLKEKYAGDERAAGFAEDKRRLACGEPVAYVIGWQPYLGLKIYLDSHPLIPRPETEWWVKELADAMSKWSGRGTADPRTFAKSVGEFSFLDLCAGSGAIGCALLQRFPNARVSFGEIDPAHAPTILKNIRENGLDESRADIRIGDLFAPFDDEQFDLVVANPPYVPSGRALAASVEHFEPALALRAGEDGLEVIRRIVEELPRRLRSGGVAWVECDSAHAQGAAALFAAQGLKAQMRTDQYGHPRVIVVSLS